ncbi:uncharacterized protein LOC117113843 [Anneissia japonica]|uniref:uncharacterized protein LOC117113843 n=1 Tax=Anneissia japonica TaxID=1529436 RepID=UPI0014255591|nr:uncharacterized protein LOC117113843 [Anneissia japonica]
MGEYHTMTEHLATGQDHFGNLSFGNAFHTFENSPWTQVSNLTPTIEWDMMAQAMVQNDEEDDDVIVLGETSERESTLWPTVREVSDAELKLTLKYRSNVVKCVNVNIRNGFRVCYNPGLSSDLNEGQLTFPEKDESFFGDSESKTRSKLYKLTSDILAKLQDGIEFSISGGVIFATRRCLAKLYCYSSQMHHGQDPVKLERNAPVPIYDYNRFEDSLKEFLINQFDPEGIRTTFPKPKIFVSCAQAWKPMHDLDHILNEMGASIQPTPLNDCLVTMEIVPLKAIDFIMSVSDSRENTESVTMSLNSDHLQISN